MTGVNAVVMIKAETSLINELAEQLVNAGPPPEGAQGPPPQVAQMEALGKKLAGGGIFLNLMLLAVLYLMIFKPGFP